MRRRRNRSQSGISLVEFTAALVFGLPPIVIMLYATLEANLLFTIRTNLDVAVRRAAQALIDDYTTNATPQPDATSSNLPAALAFDVPTSDGTHYFINNTQSGGAKQFTWTWDFSTKPYTLTVTVTYPTSKTGANKLLPFPNPDPLNIGSSMTVLTSGTFPVPAL